MKVEPKPCNAASVTLSPLSLIGGISRAVPFARRRRSVGAGARAFTPGGGVSKSPFLRFFYTARENFDIILTIQMKNIMKKQLSSPLWLKS